MQSEQPEPPEPPEPEITYGDLNGDGKVTTMDILLLRRYLTGKRELDEQQKKAADLNGDGKVTTMDILLLRRYLTGKLDKFPVQK